MSAARFRPSWRAAPRKPAPRPWLAIVDGAVVARKTTRQAAMNACHASAYRRGRAIVRHERTGEKWFRSGGSWFPDKDAAAPKPERPAPLLSAHHATKGEE